MSTGKLTAATTSSFTALMTIELDALGIDSAVLGATAIDNATNLDLEVEFSFVTGGSVTAAGSPFLAIYLYPLNGNGSTYGDGRFSSAATGPPPQSYFAGYAGGLATGARVVTSSFSRPDAQGTFIRLPRGSWKPVLHNGLGVAFSGSGNILYYRTTNIQFV